MALFHEKRLLPLDGHFCLGCLGVKSPYYDPRLFLDRMEMGTKNAVWIRILNSDEPLNVSWKNSCE
ncbi:MAG: hypothetical protein V3W43_03275 [Desulfatiglandaceae bacterium]